MKRRIRFALLFAILLSVLSVPALAADTNTYTLDELDLSVALPTDLIVVERGVDVDLSEYGIPAEQIQEEMEANDIYLDAVDPEFNFEIGITMLDSGAEGLDQFDDHDLESAIPDLIAYFEKNGLICGETELYQHSQIEFFRFEFSRLNGNDTAYGLRYSTIYAGKILNFNIQSYSGQISDSQGKILQDAVDSVRFGIGTTAPPTGGFTYTDERTLSSFTVPPGWTQKELTEQRQTIDVKFVRDEDNGSVILYGSTDVWSEMTDSERAGLTRGDVNNLYYTSSFIADTLGIPVSQVSSVEYGGVEYYKTEQTKSVEADGISQEIAVTWMLMFDHGYMYLFQFSGTFEDLYYYDFEMMLESAQYPMMTTQAASTDIPEAPIESDSGSELTPEIVIFSLLITVTFYSLPVIIYRYAIKRAPVEKNKAKKFATIYAVVVVILLFLVAEATGHGDGASGGAVAFWSYINYRILKGGKGKTGSEPAASAAAVGSVVPNETVSSAGPVAGAASESPTSPDIAREEAPPPDSKANEDVPISYCRNCGSKLQPGDAFCSKCGTKNIAGWGE